MCIYWHSKKLLFSVALGISLSSSAAAQSLDPLAPLDSLEDTLFESAFSEGVVEEQSFTVRALLEPTQSAVLASEMDGKITRIHKKDSEKFTKGDALVTFDCDSIAVERDRLKAKLNSANLIFENATQLQQLNSIGDLDVRLAEAETFVAKAELSAVNIQISRCKIKAPFNGRVIELARKQHEWISRGDPMMEIYNDNNYLMKMLVPSDWLLWLKPGYDFQVTIDETGKTYDASITKIGSRIDPVSRSVTVRGKINTIDSDFLHSMSGDAIFDPPAS